MRVKFHYIEYKNILAVGNTPVHIDLDTDETTLICGKNGDGKSTLLDALYFLLFGKPYRDIVKNLLINAVNERDLLVTGEFSAGKDRYKIVRGLKPAIFEIYENGTLLNQNAASKEYQETLETTILKMNEKSFRQIVVLGSADYVPFMKLKLADRRAVIEDLLDISIFTAMNKVVKNRVDDVKNKLKQIDYEIDLLKNQKTMLSQFIESQKLKAERSKTDSEGLIAEKESLVEAKLTEAKTLADETSTIKPLLESYSKTIKKLGEFHKIQVKFEENIKRTKETIDFYEKNDNCPMCKQGIAHSHKKELIEKAKENQELYEKNLSELQKHLESSESEKSKLDDLKIALDQKVNLIDKLKNEIAIYRQQIEQIKQQNVGFDDSELQANMVKLTDLDKSVVEKIAERSAEFENKDYLDDIKELLKDTGVKTNIIRHYIPIINKTINQYLNQLGLPINFTLDETFSETIQSRGRTGFTYYSFSEGEKGRINIAIMFSWRQIAVIKNSTNTNLLIMDETFDSSLDSDATEELLSLINQISSGGNANIFVISHKNSDMLYDRFKNVIKFKKVAGFTRIENG